jgi:type IV pilus assembly protein PilN
MVRINLLPVRVSKKKEAGRQQLVLFVLVAVLGIIGNYFWNDSRASELAGREKKLAATRAEIAQLDRIIGEVRNIKDQQQQLREKLGVLAQLKAGRAGPVKMLDELASLIPKQLWLTKLEEKGGTVSFVGTAGSIDDVSEFMSALKGSRHFRSVELGRTAAKGDGSLRLVEFTLSAAVVYPAEPAATAAAPAPGAVTPAAAGR